MNYIIELSQTFGGKVLELVYGISIKETLQLAIHVYIKHVLEIIILKC